MDGRKEGDSRREVSRLGAPMTGESKDRGGKAGGRLSFPPRLLAVATGSSRRMFVPFLSFPNCTRTFLPGVRQVRYPYE